MRLVEGVTRSLDEVTSSQEQFQAARNYSDQISETTSWASQNAQLIRKALNQDMVNWATEKLGSDEAKRILTTGNDEEKGCLINEFAAALHHQYKNDEYSSHVENLDNAFETSSIKKLDREQELQALYTKTDNDAPSFGIRRQDIGEKKSELVGKIAQAETSVDQSLQNAQNNLSEQRGRILENYDKKKEMSGPSRVFQGAFSGKYTTSNLPLGWKKE